MAEKKAQVNVQEPISESDTYVTTKNQVASILKYDYVEDFTEGLTKVRKNYKFGLIDKSGKVVIPLEYDYIENLYEGLAMVSKDGKHGFVDKTGKVVILLEYDFASDFSEGLVIVGKNRKYGFIDRTGKIIIPLEYDEASDFCEGLASVEKDGNVGFIDKEGKVIIPLEYDYTRNFKNGLVIVQKDGNRFIVDKSGNSIPNIANWFQPGEKYKQKLELAQQILKMTEDEYKDLTHRQTEDMAKTLEAESDEPTLLVEAAKYFLNEINAPLPIGEWIPIEKIAHSPRNEKWIFAVKSDLSEGKLISPLTLAMNEELGILFKNNTAKILNTGP